MDILGGVGAEVVGGLIVAGLIVLLRNSQKRKGMEQTLGQRTYRYDWQPIETDLGGELRLVTRIGTTTA